LQKEKQTALAKEEYMKEMMRRKENEEKAKKEKLADFNKKMEAFEHGDTLAKPMPLGQVDHQWTPDVNMVEVGYPSAEQRKEKMRKQAEALVDETDLQAGKTTHALFMPSRHKEKYDVSKITGRRSVL